MSHDRVISQLVNPRKCQYRYSHWFGTETCLSSWLRCFPKSSSEFSVNVLASYKNYSTSPKHKPPFNLLRVIIRGINWRSEMFCLPLEWRPLTLSCPCLRDSRWRFNFSLVEAGLSFKPRHDLIQQKWNGKRPLNPKKQTNKHSLSRWAGNTGYLNNWET